MARREEIARLVKQIVGCMQLRQLPQTSITNSSHGEANNKPADMCACYISLGGVR